MTKLNLLHRAATTAAAPAPVRRGRAGARPRARPASRGVLCGVLATLWALAGACAAPALAAAKARSRFEEQPFSTAGGSSSTAHVGGSGASIVRTIVGLLIVIAVIWGLSWILRQVKSSRGASGGVGRHHDGLTSLAALSLSSGRSVHLVRAGSDYLLLGSAEQGVVPIHRYTEEQAREAGLTDVIDARAQRPRGRALLRPPDERGSAAGAGGAVRGGHDPMRMPSPGPGTGLLDRLRELTVRR